MTWNNFTLFATGSMVLWTIGSVMAYTSSFRKGALSVLALGTLIFLCFIIGLWISLERPPMRTMGETRLLYSFFVAIVGWIIYFRWNHQWIPAFSTTLAGVFILINILKPQIHNQALMPALQSPWFVPHVIVYMYAYALMGGACLLLIYGYFKTGYSRRTILLNTADNLVYTGTALLTIGMLFGAIWAKQAWGHYWNWDPKETWAALTWLSYLAYIHIRYRYPLRYRSATILLTLSFLFLQICWYGINYLPAAAKSVHSYTIN